MISFNHPEPSRKHPPTFPVFLPFQGCPGRCIYCSQNLQTGQPSQSLSARLKNLADDLEARKKRHLPPIGLGFFGGTFTAIPREWMLRFLDVGLTYKKQGVISHIRCSTRPDAITPDMLQILARAGLDMVELGIQSFDQDILDRALRHCDQKTALAACTMIQEAGLELGLQMLPGLPGHNWQTWQEDIRTCCTIRPQIIRLYPCLVLEGTVLASWFRQGTYIPLDMEETLFQLAWAIRQLWSHGIAVIRIGLTPEPLLLDNVLAGPWHPSLGNMVRSRALAEIIEEQVHRLGHPPRSLKVPTRYSGELWGYRKGNETRLARAGITRTMVQYTPNPFFTLQ
ncbi:elongator complex protein 3 [Desulfoplanes formicivorans]|uniref:Radical SAM protein n=1 Tax=Desulfoplanes formicivorans TaxID=1592317 RepID=A0A194AHM8_9BACT|nr:radical SAM protein [Desulfoplanes formicivorans]GAU08720.1 radical SAM protein [Desulfoplanes formicivorans]